METLLTDDLSDLVEEDEPERDLSVGLACEFVLVYEHDNADRRCKTHDCPAEECLVENAVAEAVASGVKISQAAFQPVLDELIALYQNLHKTYRKDIRIRLKVIYDRLADLGCTFGVSRVSLGHL